MKTLQVTSKKTMDVPDVFTMLDLRKSNPTVTSPNTLYQRVKSLLVKGDTSPIYLVGEIKLIKGSKNGVETTGRGRSELVYAIKGTSEDHPLIQSVRAYEQQKREKAEAEANVIRVAALQVDSTSPENVVSTPEATTAVATS